MAWLCHLLYQEKSTFLQYQNFVQTLTSGLAEAVRQNEMYRLMIKDKSIHLRIVLSGTKCLSLTVILAFTKLKKCYGKFKSLSFYEMLPIKKKSPTLNTQADSIPAKLFTKLPTLFCFPHLILFYCSFTLSFLCLLRLRWKTLTYNLKKRFVNKSISNRESISDQWCRRDAKTVNDPPS